MFGYSECVTVMLTSIRTSALKKKFFFFRNGTYLGM